MVDELVVVGMVLGGILVVAMVVGMLVEADLNMELVGQDDNLVELWAVVEARCVEEVDNMEWAGMDEVPLDEEEWVEEESLELEVLEPR